MDINDYYLLSNIPSLDLHGFDREGARVAIIDFIKDSVKLKHEIVEIIHGKGEGIVKNVTYETLKKNNNVIDYKTSYYNTGITIVKLNIN